MPDDLDDPGSKGRGYYIQEAGFPEFANWLIETSQVTSSLRRAAEVAREVLVHRVRRYNESTISAEVAKLVGQGRLAASSLPLLGMGRDIADGRVVLTDGELDVEWTTFTSMKYFTTLRDTMRSLADALHADHYDNPLWWTRRVVTVHPLGGTPMGLTPHEGLGDTHGEVFGHPGLYVVDGAAMPGPVGANPALTIAANADRIVERVLEQPRQALRGTVPKDEDEEEVEDDDLTEAEPPTATGRSVAFTEQMKGFVALGETAPQQGWARGRQLNHRLMFELTITVPDIDHFLVDTDREGTAEGYVRCELLGGRLPVERGWFNLSVETRDAATREMRYRLWLRDLARAPVTLYGFKTVRDDPGFDLWRDTSTLEVTLLRGHVAPGGHGEVFGAGVLRILPRDFARQLMTFRAEGPGPLRAVAQFGGLFARSLAAAYDPRVRRERR